MLNKGRFGAVDDGIPQIARLGQTMTDQSVRAMLLIGAVITTAHFSFAESNQFLRPSAMILSEDAQSTIIADAEQPCVFHLHHATFALKKIEGLPCGLIDIVRAPGSSVLFGVSSRPAVLIAFRVAGDRIEVIQQVTLPAQPARIGVASDGLTVCVSCPWHHAVVVVPVTSAGQLAADQQSEVPCGFLPGEMLPLPDGRILLADAFSGDLGILEPGSPPGSAPRLVVHHELAGHHIGGLGFDPVSQKILWTHQRLSRIAQTTRDDLHWGMLMQNLVSSVPLTDLLSESPRKVSAWSLGTVGNGAGDPAAIVTLEDQLLVVALAGRNQIAFRRRNQVHARVLDVGIRPTRLLRISDDQILCLNAGDATISVIEIQAEPQVARVLGTPRVPETARDRGERAFYSADLTHDGWMSCSSCHVDGHSPDLLADTLGDGDYGTPKRIPSLLNTAETGPWGWDGSHVSLESQIRRTLETTMHGDAAGEQLDDFTADLSAYLQSLTLPAPGPPVLHSQDTADGLQLFEKLRCGECHRPETAFTSDRVVDVGMRDEAGQVMFNPPSLRGLRHRRRLFHDGRYRTLSEVLASHPAPLQILSPDELLILTRYLQSL